MEKVADTFRLQYRNGTWYYHRRVPSDLKGVLGKPVIKRSLRTGSKTEAKRLRPVHDVEADALFASLRGEAAVDPFINTAAKAGPGPSATKLRRVPLATLTEYLRDVVHAEDRAARKRVLSDPPLTANEASELRIDAEMVLQILADPSDNRQDTMIFSLAKKVLAMAQGEALGPEEMAAFRALARRALLELSQRQLSRANDDYGREWFDQMFDPTRPKAMSTLVLADAYLEEKRTDYHLNNVSPKRLDKTISQVGTLVEIIGPELPANCIDDEIVQNVRKVLSRLPSNRTKRFPGKPVAEAIELAQKTGSKALSATTQGQYLDELRGMLDLAVRRKVMSSNPAAIQRASGLPNGV